MRPPDPLDPMYLMAGNADLRKLKEADDQLYEVQKRLTSISRYYFPTSAVSILARSLHLVGQPDYSKYLSELETLHDAAERIIAEAEKLYKALSRTDLQNRYKQLAKFTYQRIDFDGHAIMAMFDHIKQSNEGDPASASSLARMKELWRNSRENSDNMRAWRVDFEDSTLAPSLWGDDSPA